jgi:uncharacterized protein YbaP (TraB family)
MLGTYLLKCRMARRGLLTICAGMALLLRATAPSFADPAMWVVRDEDSTVYLFGTFHLVKPEMKWRSDKIDAAFTESDELWLEVSELSDTALMQKFVVEHGIDLKHPLSSKLSKDDWSKVQSAAVLAGMPVPMIERMRPWLAGLALMMAPVREKGYDPQNGPDRQLEEGARASRKAVKGFESPEQQLQLFAGLPEQVQIAFLVEASSDLTAGLKHFDEMAEAWLSGDTRRLDSLVTSDVTAPAFYESIFVTRNLDWCDKIAEIMQGSGTSFVAVGAGHLIGDKGVPAILAERGFQVAPY